MRKRLERLAVTHPWKVCALWVIAAVALACVAPDWDRQTQDDDIRSLPASCPSSRGYQLLGEAFPQEVSASQVIFALQREDRPLTRADFALAGRMAAELERLRKEEANLQIGAVESHRDRLIGSRLTSKDGHCTLIRASLGTPYLALPTRTTVDRAEARLRRVLAEAGPNPPRLVTTGAAGIGRDLTAASADSLDRSAVATVLLVVVVLFLIYRAPLLALVPLLTIGLSVWVALDLLALATLLPGVQLATVSRVFAIVLLFGAGTDYCLFLISRYREELERDAELPAAVRRSVRAVTGALVASAGTVICGLAMMGFADFAKIRCAGPAIALGLGVALLASLTLAPALLHLLGRAVFWPRGLPDRPAGPRRSGFWDRASRVVLARPGLILTGALLVLAPSALLGWWVQSAYKPTGDLPETSQGIQGLGVIQRHFTAGETGPLTVLLQSGTDWNSPEGRELVSHLSRGFAELANVAEVRSLTQPLGTPLVSPFSKSEIRNAKSETNSKPEIPNPKPGGFGHSDLGLGNCFGFRISDFGFTKGVLARVADAARGHYTATRPNGHVTRLDVILHTDPFHPQSRATLEVIETWLRDQLPHWHLPSGTVRGECFSLTAHTRDLARVVERDRVQVNLLVLGGIFLILLALVRRAWLSAYLLATVVLSYLATLGVTAVIGALWFGQPLGTLDWRVAFFLFTILVAVGQDYNILLVTRILEERKRKSLREAVRVGLARTGSAITACGLIMAGTFGTLVLVGLGSVAQTGFALAFGVLLDTLVVRPFLVPAFLLLFWHKFERTSEERDWLAELPLPRRRPAA